MSDYDWANGVFNPACTCGGSINHPNPDCERCAMHDWIYKVVDENQRLREHIEESFCDCLDVYNEFYRVPCERCMLVATWGGPTSAHPGLTAVKRQEVKNES